MSVRMLAAELYRVMKEVESMENTLASLAPNEPEKAELERELRALRAERDRIRKILDGAKAD
jgi:predicted RNase H-like nuclease (RuvC/YqgF family)